ncbi:hypothetical protein PBN151_1830 [Paenibacillus sp. NAIST15-1]|nr:hypothetical protein PBN151_1830 [Paenibacillus sp. NAIST15-1]
MTDDSASLLLINPNISQCMIDTFLHRFPCNSWYDGDKYFGMNMKEEKENDYGNSHSYRQRG